MRPAESDRSSTPPSRCRLRARAARAPPPRHPHRDGHDATGTWPSRARQSATGSSPWAGSRQGSCPGRSGPPRPTRRRCRSVRARGPRAPGVGARSWAACRRCRPPGTVRRRPSTGAVRPSASGRPRPPGNPARGASGPRGLPRARHAPPAALAGCGPSGREPCPRRHPAGPMPPMSHRPRRAVLDRSPTHRRTRARIVRTRTTPALPSPPGHAVPRPVVAFPGLERPG